MAISETLEMSKAKKAHNLGEKDLIGFREKLVFRNEALLYMTDCQYATQLEAASLQRDGWTILSTHYNMQELTFSARCLILSEFL